MPNLDKVENAMVHALQVLCYAVEPKKAKRVYGFNLREMEPVLAHETAVDNLKEALEFLQELKKQPAPREEKNT